VQECFRYASGFRQRLGKYPEFKHDDRKVIWLHCVSVGETNAARPLVDKLIEEFPDHLLIISTITKTGQKLAQKQSRRGLLFPVRLEIQRPPRARKIPTLACNSDGNRDLAAVHSRSETLGRSGGDRERAAVCEIVRSIFPYSVVR
jgi:hypothetical protein